METKYRIIPYAGWKVGEEGYIVGSNDMKRPVYNSIGEAEAAAEAATGLPEYSICEVTGSKTIHTLRKSRPHVDHDVVRVLKVVVREDNK